LRLIEINGSLAGIGMALTLLSIVQKHGLEILA